MTRLVLLLTVILLGVLAYLTGTRWLDTHALASELGMTGTPGFVVGDDIIVGENLPEIQRAIAAQRRALPRS